MSYSSTVSTPVAQIAAVVALLEGVTGVSKVDAERGGLPTWASIPRKRQSYFEADISRISEDDAAFGGVNEESVTVVIEGWLPMDYAGKSTTYWNALVGRVRDALRTARTLSNTVMKTQPPQVTANDTHLVGGGNGPDVVCHHVRIEWTIRQQIRYTPV